MNADRLLVHWEHVIDAPDATPRLRRFVFELAMRGRLVAQDLNERRTGDLGANGMIPMPAPPFEIPGSWAWVSVGTVAKTRLGKMLDQARNKGALRLYLRNINVRWFDFDLSDLFEMRFEASELAEFALKAGDVLICEGGEPGRAAVWDGRAANVYFQKAIHRVRFHEGVDPHFFVMALRLSADDGRLSEYFTGTGIQHFTGKGLSSYAFPLPPLAEQHRIVAKVDALMALCNRLEAARAGREAVRDRLVTATLARLGAPDPETFQADARFALEALPALTTRPDQIKPLRETILNLAVRGKLVEQNANDVLALEWLYGLATQQQSKKSEPSALIRLEDFEAIYSLPSTWCWIELGKLVTIMDAGWSPQCENHPRRDISIWGVLKTTAVQKLSFDCSQNKELPSRFQPRPQHEAEVGDILITRAGPKNRVGVSCVVDETQPRLMISDKLIRFRLFDGRSPRFFALCLNAGVSDEAIEAAKSGMAVMQMNISQDKLRAVPVPLPPLAEQHRIVAKVDELMALCDQLEASLEAAAATRRRLLDALLAEALEPAGLAEAA